MYYFGLLVYWFIVLFFWLLVLFRLLCDMEGEQSEPVTVSKSYKPHRRGKVLLFDALSSYHVVGGQVKRFRLEFPDLNRRLVMSCIAVYMSDGLNIVYKHKNAVSTDKYINIKNGLYSLTDAGHRIVIGCLFALRHAREKGKQNKALFGITRRFND